MMKYKINEINIHIYKFLTLLVEVTSVSEIICLDDCFVEPIYSTRIKIIVPLNKFH